MVDFPYFNSKQTKILQPLNMMGVVRSVSVHTVTYLNSQSHPTYLNLFKKSIDFVNKSVVFRRTKKKTFFSRFSNCFISLTVYIALQSLII